MMRSLLIALPFLLSATCLAADVEVLQHTIVDTNALNFAEGDDTRFSLNINGRTYQRPPTVTFKGYQYTTYYDDNRNVCLGRRELPAGNWEVIRFTDYTMPGSDSHNVVTLGICSADGTIHLLFDHHADPVNYRASVLGVASDPESVVWDTNLFGPVVNTIGAAGSFSKLTYPYFFDAPSGNLMLYFRSGGSGSGDGMIQEYDGTTHEWTTGLGKFIARTGTYSGAYSSNSTSRNPYLNGISYAGNRLHVTWCWRETASSSASNHDLCYAYSDDDGRTWHNNAGVVIGTTGSSFITVDSPGLVVAPIPQNEGLSNQYTHYAFADGTCHVVVRHHNPGTSTQRYQHYWRDAAGNWHGESLPFSGSRPKLAGDNDGNLFLVYVDGGKLQIAKGVPNAGQTAWSWSTVHTQSDSTEGGEGQIDYPRWEEDRVLSVYGQEKPTTVLNYGSGTPINGLPSPLHVIDYHVSSKAILPQPLYAEDQVNRGTVLQWTAGIDAVSHQVFLGTDFMAVALATTSSPEFMGQQGNTTHPSTGLLEPETEYFWRIDEVQAGGEIIPGLIWSFTTELGPTNTLVTMTTLGSPQTWSTASIWDNLAPPTPGFDYVVPATGNLKSLDNTSTFAGDSLIVLGGGKVQFRGRQELGHLTTIGNLILTGGTPAEFVNLSAGTGTDTTNHLAGHIANDGFTKLNGYGDVSGPRNMRISSSIAGDGTLHTSGWSAFPHTCIIDHPSNTFAGVWQINVGTLVFENAGAAGAASIEVLDTGSLVIEGDWDQSTDGTSLVVNDSATALVDLGSYTWTVSNVTVGATNLMEGTYSVEDLNGLSAAVFTGAGQLIVGVSEVGTPDPPPLEVGLVGGDLIFSWSEGGFKLQTLTNDLSSAQWFDVPGGDASPVTVEPALPAAFFRLIEE